MSAERKPRCLLLVVEENELVDGEHGRNQCTSERVPGASLCIRHLAEAGNDYLAILDAQWKAAAA